jgi:hypothetical protein
MSRSHFSINRLTFAVAALSLVTYVGGNLYLAPSRQIFKALKIESSMVAFSASGPYWAWFGIVLSPLVGWLYHQRQLSRILSIVILSMTAVISIGYPIISYLMLASIKFEKLGSAFM